MSNKGPKWSGDSVRALFMVVRGKVERAYGLDDRGLEEECGKRIELERFKGRSMEIKREAVLDWIWSTAHLALEGTRVAVEEPTRNVVVDVESELMKVVELLKRNGSATEGGIRNALFEKNKKIVPDVLEYGYVMGKLKKTRLASGMEVIVVVEEGGKV